MHEFEIIDKKSAFSGEIGRQRKEFCIDFIQQKHASFRRIQNDITAQIAKQGETVACHKGCPSCCVMYVEANVQECEAIAYYLYEKPLVMSHFLKQYEWWRDRMRRLGDPFDRCEKVLHLKPGEELSRYDRDILFNVLQLYHEANIPCSFLDEGACSIYEVRPYCCVNHYVTTPEDWCRSENCCNPTFSHRPKVYMTDIDEIDSRSFYLRDLSRPVIGFLPTTVYRILTEGLEYISELTGIESLVR